MQYDWIKTPIEDPPKGVKCNPLDLYPLSERAELERLAIFAMFVAGKGAAAIWPKTQLMFAGKESPFERIRKWVKDKQEAKVLKDHMIGNYTRHISAFRTIAQFPKDWTWDKLLYVTGISHKTAKLVQMYTWPGRDRCACIDRHILRWLREPNVLPKDLRKIIPENSPQDYRLYSAIEGIVMRFADRYNLLDWELDRIIWKAGQKGTSGKLALREWLWDGQGRHRSASYRPDAPPLPADVVIVNEDLRGLR